LTIEIQPAPRPTGTLNVRTGIDDRIDEKLVAAGALGRIMQEFQKLNGRVHAAFLVAMNPREQAYPEITASFHRAGEEISRKTLREAKTIAICQMRREQIVRSVRQRVERTQKRLERSALFYRWTAGVDTGIGILVYP
jgi:hypothetical protein